MFFPTLIIAVMMGVLSAKSIDEAPREETEVERIIGGRTATPGQFPWAAALYYDGKFVCTSSIISPTTVLTAAHCVVFEGVLQSPDNYYAIANVDRTASRVRIDFASVTAHPGYSDQLIDNDVAIFKTTEPIPFNDEVHPICIAAPDADRAAYKRAIAMGWGNAGYSRLFPVLPNKLQYVTQKIVRNSLCSFVNAGVNDDKICATGLFNGICNGDSGGPLVHLSSGKEPVQIGIASYGNGIVGCGTPVPSVWTLVGAHYDFIMQAAEDGQICSV